MCRARDLNLSDRSDSLRPNPACKADSQMKIGKEEEEGNHAWRDGGRKEKKVQRKMESRWLIGISYLLRFARVPKVVIRSHQNRSPSKLTYDEPLRMSAVNVQWNKRGSEPTTDELAVKTNLFEWGIYVAKSAKWWLCPDTLEYYSFPFLRLKYVSISVLASISRPYASQVTKIHYFLHSYRPVFQKWQSLTNPA